MTPSKDEPPAKWASFDNFFDCEYNKVYRVVFLFSGDPDTSEDATQEAFSRAFARWSRLRDEAWAAGWTVTTALNECKRLRRQVSSDVLTLILS